MDQVGPKPPRVAAGNRTERASARWSISGELFFDHVLDAIADPVFVKDQDHRWVAFNAAFERFLGRSRDDLLGRSDHDFLRKEEADVFWRKDEEVFRSGRENINEEAFTGPTGETRTIRTRKAPFTGRDGRKYLVAVIHDITDLKDTEAALRRTAADLSHAQRIAHIGSWQWEVATDELQWSDELYRIFGVEKGRFHPTFASLLEATHPDDRARLKDILELRKKKTADQIDFEHRIMRPDGTLRIVHVQSDLEYVDNESQHVVGVVYDVTETRMAEHVLRSSEQTLRRHLLDVIKVLSRTIEARDPYTSGHEERVAALAVAIGRELGLSDGQIANLEMGALIHDIGKIYIPGEILTRPGRLTKEEFELIKTHAQIGYNIVKDVEIPSAAADMILQHHERLDGSGYPQGLKGDAIRLEARILAVADVVESMSAHRPYRPSRGIENGLEEVLAHRGTRYDETAVNACVRLVREKGFTLPDPAAKSRASDS